MSFTIRKLDHVQLAAPRGSENTARKFYSDILQMREIEKPEVLKKRGGAWFQFGSNQLHIGIEEPFQPAKKAHPAFEVESLEDLKLYLKERDVNFLEDPHLPGAERVYVEDPFGNRLEFLEWE
ncbi:glyoxalase [Gracilibacillus oryzae]|uniref:Glyoxalase n=1 Tax=Gracilibacillus oryzae TaxID=1672701 RepID=A0A7C8KRY4_9BACI|nr:VOC family protein [Gracilibacillus oryzae]KAB8125868.1 glyoxalase [Gracilibacillus oryzae]